jgi:segregation and condensation protein A
MPGAHHIRISGAFMEKLSFKLLAFEGPLDLLLHLIAKNKLNIYDIPISELLDQYLSYIGTMEEMDLALTSDFLEMASRLVQIKSAMLLPSPEDDADPREGLVATLLEYGSCKALAEQLGSRAGGFELYTREPLPIEHDASYKSSHDPSELVAACLAFTRKMKSRRPVTEAAFKNLFASKVVSVASRVVHIIRRLLREGRQELGSLYEDSSGRSEAVATFLAVLELLNAKRINIKKVAGREVVEIKNKR